MTRSLQRLAALVLFALLPLQISFAQALPPGVRPACAAAACAARGGPTQPARLTRPAWCGRWTMRRAWAARRMLESADCPALPRRSAAPNGMGAQPVPPAANTRLTARA